MINELNNARYQRPTRSAWHVVLGVALLLLCDLAMSVGGFRGLHTLVRWFPVRTQRQYGGRLEGLCHCMDHAASLYVRRCWCLQRSAATVCLLRLAGFPARLVVGVRKVPFYAHAWVECDGTVLDSEISVLDYLVLERC